MSILLPASNLVYYWMNASIKTCIYCASMQIVYRYGCPCTHNTMSIHPPSYNVERHGFSFTVVLSDDVVSLIVCTCNGSVIMFVFQCSY